MENHTEKDAPGRRFFNVFVSHMIGKHVNILIADYLVVVVVTLTRIIKSVVTG